MQKCSNATCGRCISTTHRPYIRAEVAVATQYWCSDVCLEEWQQQNMVFTIAADPFKRPAPRLRTAGYVSNRDLGDENDYRPQKVPIG